MNGRLRLAAVVAVVGVMAVGTVVAVAGGDRPIRSGLTGYEETPLALSTPGEGRFKLRIDRHDREIFYRLSYADLEAAVTQAHIHFGARAQSGGVSVFLCSNVGGPPGTQACPPAPATITGTIEPTDVIGPAAQGIAAGEFDELVDAINAGATYANVHTEKYPAGEIRAQIER
jgi:hypothetical protein